GSCNLVGEGGYHSSTCRGTTCDDWGCRIDRQGECPAAGDRAAAGAVGRTNGDAVWASCIRTCRGRAGDHTREGVDGQTRGQTRCVVTGRGTGCRDLIG